MGRYLTRVHTTKTARLPAMRTACLVTCNTLRRLGLGTDAGDSPGERGAVASRRPGPDDPATEEPAILLVGGDENDPIRIRPSARQLHYYRRNPIALPT